jgi:hypothetical protein
MFHDAVMWLIFFVVFIMYIKKPNLSVKIFGLVMLTSLILLIQAFKQDYRQRIWVDGETANLKTISEVGSEKVNSDILIGENNLLNTLSRSNQAWIFASTVDNMNKTNDFQGLKNVSLYLEAAILPRFLSRNKIKSGERTIFNKFSGHEVSAGTAMGLGIFADGYIAYGNWGVYFFTFFLGLIFSIIFKIIEHWISISPIYMLLLLPILNYAVRPDCELQTTINHIVKSIIVFGVLVNFSKYKFSLDSVYSK